MMQVCFDHRLCFAPENFCPPSGEEQKHKLLILLLLKMKSVKKWTVPRRKCVYWTCRDFLYVNAPQMISARDISTVVLVRRLKSVALMVLLILPGKLLVLRCQEVFYIFSVRNLLSTELCFLLPTCTFCMPGYHITAASRWVGFKWKLIQILVNASSG